MFQYIHGLAARGVHYLHQPGPTLQDVGFSILLELGQDKAYIIPQGILYGCGDLIFSSHMFFSLVFVRTYQKYGTQRFIKQCAWLIVVIQSLLIIASLKHYTVDFVVAWYTVNLVVFFIDHKFPELPDHTGGGALLLPVSKDDRTKEEDHNLLNGNSGDPVDWGLRTQVNGKILEDGNAVHVDTVMNDS